MLFTYEEKMPLRILDEGQFWKRQEMEHTQVIRALVTNLEPQFVQALEVWEQAFSQTEGLFTRYIEAVVRSGSHVGPEMHGQIMQLVCFAAEQSQQFILFLNYLLANSQPIKTNQTAIVVLNHIRRESEYFIGIAESLLYKR
ncbi:DUF2935 domain-containing protein [Aneurinibacillus sp. Ricciae_BoGa-3]|uniref:DUF2935 domain-containing protein n=1 Tax=Aneurinibacillus sp. Ricciae_BoGa-3 TaxID=3022697 RepID=UPI002341C1EB|nr:DUF2935 domain-containing protein [Aneurinibacillus sp. Ricciae_BoGa-3]WCK55981.1 DUF2935 domain-containing protein [Aneurinibacillus sp. Ricciae_BoGa-3]